MLANNALCGTGRARHLLHTCFQECETPLQVIRLHDLPRCLGGEGAHFPHHGKILRTVFGILPNLFEGL